MEKIFLEPKWISSIYALSAFSVCVLKFTYNQTGFVEGLTKTFFTVIAFYVFGIVTSSIVNFIVLNFVNEEEKNTQLNNEQNDNINKNAEETQENTA